MPAMKLQCDLVMRGGIASGLVYPRAIAKLAPRPMTSARSAVLRLAR